MLIPKLALRNILSAGLRTWLNVVVLSIAFVLIIGTQGLFNGMSKEAMTSLTDMEYGGGQFWHQAYDPYDPLTLEDAHAPLSAPLQALIANGQATPMLITSGAIFPEGRVQTVVLKGIDPEQQILKFPAEVLRNADSEEIPALIGARMAKQANLKIGDLVTVRWRDMLGTFDAADLRIVQIMSTTVQSVDMGIVWLPLAVLQKMLQAPAHATLVVLQKNAPLTVANEPPWVFRDPDYLLSDIKLLVVTHRIEYAVLYTLLLGMAMLAIFDTQVLAIFRRRKEMGTMMALGMPRSTIIGLFTVEGALHGLLAILIGALYGIPLLTLFAATGFTYPQDMVEQTGFAIPTTLYPIYGVWLVIGTTVLVLVTVTVVSFLPTRRIVHLNPTEALKGKLV